MTLATLLNRACTITSRTFDGSVDDYGDETATETSVSTVCELQQQRRDETGDPATRAASTWALFLPAGTTIGPADTVTIDGDDYELVGEAWPARNPRTQTVSHIEATVRRVTGAQEA